MNEGSLPLAHRSALSTPRLPFRVHTFLMAVVLCFVCFYGLNSVALIDLADEGIYASVARQMIDSGDWVTPRYGPTIFFYKPPLSYWCQALFIYLLGPTPLAARLPSALAAFLTALSLYYWAKRKGLLHAGWLAATLYALCPLVAYGLARVAMMDSLLTFCFTLAIIGWIEGYGGNRRGYMLMAAGMALATMTKGLIGFLLPGAAFVIWLLVRRDAEALRGVPWAAFVSIFLALVLPWHIAAWRAHGNWFLSEYIVRQHFARFLGQDFGHQSPFWYYLPVLLLSTFPWCALMLVAWWRGVRAWRSEKSSLDCVMAMWALWALVVFLFFSLSGSKLPNYILPALPALALLVAWRLESVWQDKRGLSIFEVTGLSAPGLLLGTLLFIVGVSAYGWRSQPQTPTWLAKSLGRLLNWKEQSQTVAMLWQKLDVVTSLASYWTTLGALLFCGSLVILICWRNARRAVYASMALSLALIILAAHIGLPAWSNATTAPLNELGQRTIPALERGEPLLLYALHPKRPSLRYLLGHSPQVVETFSPEALQSVLQNAGRGYVITAHDNTLPILPGDLRREALAGQWALWRYERSDE